MKRFSTLALVSLMIAATLGATIIPARAEVKYAPVMRPRYALTDNLVAYWKLEEASGTRFDELTGCGGGGCDLTANNNPGNAAGKHGNAVQLTLANSQWIS